MTHRTATIAMAATAGLLLGNVHAATPCEQLKAEIEQKIEANGVPVFSLNVVPKDEAAEGKVVGGCGGGTMKIMYVRGEPASPGASDAMPEPGED